MDKSNSVRNFFAKLRITLVHLIEAIPSKKHSKSMMTIYISQYTYTIVPFSEIAFETNRL